MFYSLVWKHDGNGLNLTVCEAEKKRVQMHVCALVWECIKQNDES